MDANEFRDAIRWDRYLIGGIAVVVFLLFFLIAWQLTLLRKDMVDVRIAATALTSRVDSIDAHGSRALAEHKLEAHDRAK
jgi:hypothetical protein